MKKLMILCWVFILIFTFSTAQAGTYTFTPSDNDIFELDHYYAYKWKPQTWFLPAGETIVGASLFFDDIYNWANESNDILYLQLMDSYPTGGTRPGNTGNIWQYSDNQASDNFFNSYGIQLGTYTDISDLHADDYTFNFSTSQLTTLTNYATDGLFYLGFDPDCHYYNTGITFKIETERQSVPEPSTFLLLGFGLLFGVGFMRKRVRENA